MTKRTNTSKLFQAAMVTMFVSSTLFVIPAAEAGQGCRTGYHPNPYNPAQCVANGTTGLAGRCNPGQHRWYNPRTQQWYLCR